MSYHNKLNPHNNQLVRNPKKKKRNCQKIQQRTLNQLTKKFKNYRNNRLISKLLKFKLKNNNIHNNLMPIKDINSSLMDFTHNLINNNSILTNIKDTLHINSLNINKFNNNLTLKIIHNKITQDNTTININNSKGKIITNFNHNKIYPNHKQFNNPQYNK